MTFRNTDLVDMCADTYTVLIGFNNIECIEFDLSNILMFYILSNLNCQVKDTKLSKTPKQWILRSYCISKMQFFARQIIEKNF